MGVLEKIKEIELEVRLHMVYKNHEYIFNDERSPLRRYSSDWMRGKDE